MSDPKDTPLFDEPLEFYGIVFSEPKEPLPDDVMARLVAVDYSKVTYVDLTDGEFFKYRPKAKDL